MPDAQLISQNDHWIIVERQCPRCGELHRTRHRRAVFGKRRSVSAWTPCCRVYIQLAIPPKTLSDECATEEGQSRIPMQPNNLTTAREAAESITFTMRSRCNMNKFDIMKEFSNGFAASLTPKERSLSESDHWLAGYDAGCEFRATKNELMNEYLVSIGHKPWGIVRLA